MRKTGKQRARQIKILLFSGFLLLLVAFLVATTMGRREFSAPHKLAIEIIGTAQYGLNRVSGFFSTFWKNYAALVSVREENSRLREELQKYKSLNNQYREAVATNVRLGKLLEMKETLPAPTLTAEIIAMDPSHWFKTAIIDRGSSDGVQVGMPAMTAEGIAGQVISSSPTYAKILLTTDPNSAIDALIQKTRVQGIIRGDGKGYRMDYVLKNAEVQKGDWIVTSGIGGIFPKGIPVGTVSRVEKSKWGMFQTIEIQPVSDFSRLEHVIVFMKKDPLAK